MKPTSTTTSDRTVLLAVTFGLGAPGGGVLIVLFWWLLTLVVDPANADEWWEYVLLAAYLLAPIWAPLLAGFATLRLVTRLGWVDLRSS